MNASQSPRQPGRRRIAGEAKPSDVSGPNSPVTPPKPKLPKRPKPEPPAAATTSDLPAAPPRPDSIRVPRAKPSKLFIILLVAAVASVGFGGFGAWYGIDQWRSNNIAESRDAASDAAASAAETIFSYQYNKLPEHLSASQKVMTPKFATKFRAISPALNKLAPQRHIQVKAVVRNVAAVECGDDCSPDKAKVLIFIDQARIADGDDKPTVFGNRILVSMVKLNSNWRVANIKAL